MEALGLKEVSRVMKVGDTVADILEGKNAGLVSVGILEGSSVLGLTEQEYKDLSPEERKEREEKAEEVYRQAGADYVIRDIRKVLELL